MTPGKRPESQSKPELVAAEEQTFTEIVRLIAKSREKAFQSVNTALVELY